jgi:hypothetical protein
MGRDEGTGCDGRKSFDLRVLMAGFQVQRSEETIARDRSPLELPAHPQSGQAILNPFSVAITGGMPSAPWANVLGDLHRFLQFLLDANDQTTNRSIRSMDPFGNLFVREIL